MDLICQRVRYYEPEHSECLCSELTFTNKKWICFFSIYRLSDSKSFDVFRRTDNISKQSNPEIWQPWNLLIMGYFNLEVKSKSLGYDQLDEFCDLFNLINFIKLETCFTKNCIFYLDLFLINTTFSVQITHVMRPV